MIEDLFDAVRNYDTAATERLLTRIHPDTRDECGRTPLMVAVEYRAIEIVALLIRRGASLELSDIDGWTALDLASADGDKLLVGLLRGAA